MEQQRAVNALESYILLSKDAKSPRAAADLIVRATSDPNTYVFAELLQTPNIHALRDSSDYASHYTLLEIFAWGTWSDYHGMTPCLQCLRRLTTSTAATGLPKLTPQQEQKLRLLSLLPLARQQSNLTYKSLQSALSLDSPQALESLITTAIYTSLITGTIDPAHKMINITSVAPLRDLAPGSIPALTAALTQWSQQCSSMLAKLDAQITQTKDDAQARGRQNARLEALLEERVSKEETEDGKRAKRGAPGQGFDTRDEYEDDEMEVDGGTLADIGRRATGRMSKRLGFGSRMG
jgi:COP9 signalosome complex subunit 7